MEVACLRQNCLLFMGQSLQGRNLTGEWKKNRRVIKISRTDPSTIKGLVVPYSLQGRKLIGEWKKNRRAIKISRADPSTIKGQVVPYSLQGRKLIGEWKKNRRVIKISRAVHSTIKGQVVPYSLQGRNLTGEWKKNRRVIKISRVDPSTIKGLVVLYSWGDLMKPQFDRHNNRLYMREEEKRRVKYLHFFNFIYLFIGGLFIFSQNQISWNEKKKMKKSDQLFYLF